jgi:hypothetical protein
MFFLKLFRTGQVFSSPQHCSNKAAYTHNEGCHSVWVSANMGLSGETIVGILAVLVAAPPALFALLKIIQRRRTVASQQSLGLQQAAALNADPRNA